MFYVIFNLIWFIAIVSDYETDGEDKFDDPDAENDPVSKMDLQVRMNARNLKKKEIFI